MAEFRAAQSGVEQLGAQLTLLLERVQSSIDGYLNEKTVHEMETVLQQLQVSSAYSTSG